ncbi:MAG: hypothetical protein RPR40_07400 [Bermanella sp.]
MANRIGDLTIKMGLSDGPKFKTEVEQAKQIVRGYGREANSAQRANDSFAGGFGRGADRIAGGASGIKTSLTGVVAGFGLLVTAGAGVVAMANSVAGGQALMAREWDSMALRSGQNVAVLQSMAYATAQYNISAEKTADILKDLTDKTGDFLATGGGEFADFFENIGSKVDLTAESFAKLSGPDALIALKNAMDDTSTSAAEQVFYFEALASDASLLIPLLANNGEELRRMDQRFKQLNVTLTNSEITKLKKYQQDVDDLSLAWQAFTREAIMPFVSEMGEVNQAWAQFFAQGRRNMLATSINRAHTEAVALKEEITELEEHIRTGPKHGGVSFLDAFLGNTNKQENLAKLKGDLSEIQSELREHQQRMAELDGHPGEGGKGGTNTGLSASAQKELDALNAKGVDRLAMLDRQYTTEQGRLQLDHEKTLEEINDLQVSEQELKARGYESLNALRDDYSEQQKEFYAEQAADLEARQAEANERELAVVQRQEDQKREIAVRAAKQRAATEERIERSLLSAKFQVANQSLGLIASTSKEGSSIQKAAFFAQKALSAAQIRIQGEVAAMAALSLPPFGLGPVAGQPLASTIRLTSAASAGLVLGTSIAGFRELGGGVNRGSSYVVGEKGAEVFTPGVGGQITSANNLSRLGGGGGVEVHIHDAPPGSRVERRVEGGREMVDVFLADMDEDGEMSQTMQHKFGLERQGI